MSKEGKKRKIHVLDTTLRDGEQVPGAKLNLKEKLEVARQLGRLKVDTIEAGFPASSPGDLEAVKQIAKEVGTEEGPIITGLARAVKEDIDAVYESVKYAEKPLIHIVLGTSNIHLNKKFRSSREEILQKGVEAVKYAKQLVPEVQYSTEDAARSDFEYLWQTIEAVVKAGATIINVPDTVGYAVPEQFGELIYKINQKLKNLNDEVLLSVHCHNDLGLATANTLMAVKNGADRVECTINGIGERAGNAALEEVVMGIKTRNEYYQAYTDINTAEIRKTSRLVSNIMGLDVQVNKAITGDNAFSHSSGIHQDGLLKSKDVYEIISPEEVGCPVMEMILTARSGKHAFRNAVEKIGYQVDEKEFDQLFTKYLELADKKKEIYYHDLLYLVEDFMIEKHGEEHLENNGSGIKMYELLTAQVVSNDFFPTAAVRVKKGEKVIEESGTGDGPVDALYTAIKAIVDIDVELEEYKISSISRGKEALGRVGIQLKYNNKIYASRAVDTDIIKASAVAFLNGVNRIVMDVI
ncbi:MAG: 2-isopropylmalate synthase [Halothermotrichaceae bacterium]